LQQQCKDEHTAGMPTSSTRCDLMKAKADLDQEKAYLKVDKSELLKVHQAYIDERRSAIKNERAALQSSEKSLHAGLAKGNANSVLYAQEVVNRKHELKQDEIALKRAITSRNADLLATNKKIKEANGESPVTLAFENSTAKTQNAFMK
jgi:hypothetical protein